MITTMIDPLQNAFLALYEFLMEPSEGKFCDLHHYHSMVRDVHGAALSSCSVMVALCFALRVWNDPRSSTTFCKFMTYEIINMTLATLCHIFGLKLNDFMLTTFAATMLAPTILELYEEKEQGGAWYFSWMPRGVYKIAGLLVPMATLYPPMAPMVYILFVLLPAQPQIHTATSHLANVFILFSLGPIFYELSNDGICPNHFPVHALSDACAMFYVMHICLHLQDVDLGATPAAAAKKKEEKKQSS